MPTPEHRAVTIDREAIRAIVEQPREEADRVDSDDRYAFGLATGLRRAALIVRDTLAS